MKAKELFEKLGYEQKVFDHEKRCVNGFEYEVNGIEYIKKDEESEMQRIGMVRTKYIDFYLDSKEIETYYKVKFRDGIEKDGETSGILNMELFNAIQKQIEELGW
jgi:hypothetical protein